MKQVNKSILLWYTPGEMYDLVTGVEAYPKFLPWCEHAEVTDASPDRMTVRLHLSYAGVRHAFTTRNQQVPGESVVLRLVDGPFSLLEGSWRFIPIGGANPDIRACRIEFELRYAFSSRALETVLSPVFDRVANTFVDSFVQRAEQIYGQR